ncbi:MAG TPA: glycosyltransferase family 4 protein [Vicinamibacterales bacterium]|nr:glycosyltransferase family 4 protein [Vicinamibacterales bacterium]
MPARLLSILLVGDYPDDPRLGSSKVSHKLREEFAALGHRCDVLWSADIGVRPAWRQVRQLVSPWMAGRAIVAREGRKRYDVIDVASAEGLFMGLFDLLPDRSRAAYICRSHGLEHLNYARMLDDHHEGLRSKSWLRRAWYPASRLTQVAAAARLADALIVINDVDRQYAVDRGWQPSDRVSVIPHGISTRFIADAPLSGAARGAGLLFCGTWDYVKGTPYVCAALNRLHADGRQVRLTVLGPGAPAETVLAGFDAAVRPFVTVVDRVAEQRVMEEYRRHDALLFTSTYEGFGLVVIEAMSQCLPVIATSAGCAATLVRDGETGYRVPTRDGRAVASAVRRVLENPVEASQVADKARAAVERMTWRSTAEQTLAVYESALSRVRAVSK